MIITERRCHEELAAIIEPSDTVTGPGIMIPVVTVVAQAIEHVHRVTRSAPAPLLDSGLPEPSSIMIVVTEP